VSALHGPGFDRLWTQARAAWQRRGASGDARIAFDALTREEVRALDGLPWPGRYRPLVPGGRFERRLLALEQALAERGEALLEVLERHGGPVADVRAERRAAEAARVELLASLEELIAHSGHPALHEWLASARLRPEDEDRARVAVSIVAGLPADEPIDRAVLAARACAGDSHALDTGTALERLLRRLLQHVDGCPDAELGTLEVRRLYERFGIELDPTSAPALTLGLPGDDESACGRLLAAVPSRAAVLTYGMLRDGPPRWRGVERAFVCENPSVVHAAERRLGARCAPLVCTAGWPGSAVQLLLASARDAGVTLGHHADFDVDGVAMHEHLAARYGVLPWRFDAAAYRRAAAARAPLPRLPSTDAVGALADALRDVGSQVVEELVLDDLLADLAA